MKEELEVLLDNIFSNGAEEDEESYKNNKERVISLFESSNNEQLLPSDTFNISIKHNGDLERICKLTAKRFNVVCESEFICTEWGFLSDSYKCNVFIKGKNLEQAKEFFLNLL